VITSENLKRSIDILKALVFLGVYMNIYIVNISLRNPRISINDCKINSTRIDSLFLKKILLEVFNTPRHIRSFPLLLMFFNLMPCEAYLSKFCLKLLDKKFSLQFRTILMFLHGKINKVSLTRVSMRCDMIQSRLQESNILLVARNNKGM
jgi:hypothetical protein